MPLTADVKKTRLVRLLCGGGALVGFALLIVALVKPAAAADLGGAPRRTTYDAVEPRTNIERWTGFYLGASLGGSFGATDVRGDFGRASLDAKGWNGGILAGYNWQVGRLVFGLEADVSKLNLKGSVTNGANVQLLDIDAMGSMRARAGFLMTPSMLVYATGGFAWARSEIGLSGADRSKQTLTGWQGGLGTELMLNPKWTMRLEYIYTDLGDKSLSQFGQSNTFDTTFHTVRAGLTFRF